MTACLSAPLVPCFMTFSFCSGMRRNQNFETTFLDEKVTCIFRLFVFSIFFAPFLFSFCYLFAAMIDLPLGLLPVQISANRDEKILPWSSGSVAT